MTQIRIRQAALALAAVAALIPWSPVFAARAEKNQAEDAAAPAPAFPSTYAPLPSAPTLIRGGTYLLGTGERLEGAAILLQDGKVAAVGADLQAPEGAVVIDAAGKWVTPGLIDVHSHLGLFPSPSLPAHDDGNEGTSPVTADVWGEHSVWPQDPGFARAMAGGITTLQILPGSSNLIGGRSVTLKNVPSRTVSGMKFPGAPYGLKMACGENPKRGYGARNQAPSTRMGNVAGYRKAWIDAQNYRRQHGSGERRGSKTGDKPATRDLELETLAGALAGDILVHIHCYRADEMAMMLDLAREFGYKVTAFHHAVESYKIADLLAEADVCSAMWADWWGFKLEAFDGIRENIALVEQAGACAIVHSDSEQGIQRLNQEAAKVIASARRIGIDIPRERAIRWLTANPAKALGIGEQTGTLEVGKMADVVIWSGDPFSVYSKAEQVYVDGALVYHRGWAERQPMSDFELGILGGAGEGR